MTKNLLYKNQNLPKINREKDHKTFKQVAFPKLIIYPNSCIFFRKMSTLSEKNIILTPILL